MEILTTPNPKLRQKSTKVGQITPEIEDIIAQMRQSSADWEKEHEFELSAAMAAPQLGYNKRIIIIREDMNDKKNPNFIALINPEIIKKAHSNLITKAASPSQPFMASFPATVEPASKPCSKTAPTFASKPPTISPASSSTKSIISTASSSSTTSKTKPTLSSSSTTKAT